MVLDAFCGCGTALVAAQSKGRQWIGIDVSPTACRVMAKRMTDACGLAQSETLWKAGRALSSAICLGHLRDFGSYRISSSRTGLLSLSAACPT